MKQTRTSNSVRNIIFSTASRLTVLLLQFVNRFVFVKMLTADYLGLSGLFSNILSVLSLTEMGIGTAIVFSMYKPLAEDDHEKVKSLMALFKRFYTSIGLFVLVAGGLLSPFLSIFIKDMPTNMPLIHVYYLLFVLDSGLSYFYAYKISLLGCDQKLYISSIGEAVCNIATKLLQIFVLIYTGDYLLFLLTQVVLAFLEKVVVSRIVDKQYPYLSEKNVKALDDAEKHEIKQNVFALFFHKIGDVIVNATDNIIITKMLGLAVEGVYSNYYMIVGSVSTIMTGAINAVIGSVGNLAAVSSKKEQQQFFSKLLFANYWIFAFCTVCLFCLTEPFLMLLFGEAYVLGGWSMWAIAGCFYFIGMRRTVGIFKEATGLFWNDRFRPLIEGAVNLAVSIFLAKRFGVAGVRLGTIIGTVGVSLWMEAYVLFNYHFNDGFSAYLLKQLKYAVLTAAICFFTKYLCSLLPVSIAGFVLSCVVCLVLPNLVFVLIFRKTSEYTYLKGLAAGMLRKLSRK